MPTFKEKVQELLNKLIDRQEEHINVLKDIKVLKTSEDGEIYVLHSSIAMAYSECIEGLKKILKEDN